MNQSVAAQHQISINVYSNFNIYQYHPGDLWLAYGIAIGSTLLCTVLGFYAVWRNRGASFQNVFSSYVRTAYHERNLQGLVDRFDTGAEPLPKDIAEARVVLAQKAR